MSTQPVKEFIDDSYRLITSGSPTVPLHGNDQQKAINFLNRLLQRYSSTALLTPIASLVSLPLETNIAFVYYTSPEFVVPSPPPTDTYYYTQGRLSNLENAWIRLNGLDYPLFPESRNVFFDSYKYFPLAGLPRYIIITNYVDYTVAQIYPKPSQFYELFVYGKFELPWITVDGTMANVPSYMIMFLQFALARVLSLYKSRSAAWTESHEMQYKEMRDEIEATSASNLAISSDDDSYLNGHWRVMAGI